MHSAGETMTDQEKASPKFLRKPVRLSFKRNRPFRQEIRRKPSVDQSGTQDDDVATNGASAGATPANLVTAAESMTANQLSAEFESTNQGNSNSDTLRVPSIGASCASDQSKDKKSDRTSSELNDLLYSVGSSFASFMGVVGKHALSGALSVMQKTLQYVPEYPGDWSDEDDDEAVDQWHDAQYDDSDSDEFEDALEQVSVSMASTNRYMYFWNLGLFSMNILIG